MEKQAQDIILAPVVTEKSMIAMADRKYTFKVKKDSNKFEIAKAVETLFGVEVEKVNTVHVRGAKRRRGNTVGYRPDWKKAIVTLKVGSKNIEFFESMM